MKKLFGFFGRWRRRAKTLKIAASECLEAQKYIDEFMEAVKDTITDKTILAKLRRAKIELIEAQRAVRQVVESWK